jgi:hypothetical protein
MTSDAPQGRRSPFSEILTSRKTILLLLFCATGFLGLPLLWMSRAFTTTEKIVWSILNTLYTSALIAIAIGVCYWCYRQFQNAGFL